MLLIDLSKKAYAFEWSPACKQAFQTHIKKYAPVRSIYAPNPTMSLELHTDASKVVLSGILYLE